MEMLITFVVWLVLFLAAKMVLESKFWAFLIATGLCYLFSATQIIDCVSRWP